MNGISERRADSGSLGTLLFVERPPFRASVSEFGGDDEATFHTHDFGAVIISHEPCTPAFRALLNSNLARRSFFTHLLFLLFLLGLGEGTV